MILLRIEDDALTPRYLQRGDAERPQVCSSPNMLDRFSGRVLLMTSREAMAGDTQPFDVSASIRTLTLLRVLRNKVKDL